MTVLGIDPGSKRIGYGLIEKEGSKIKFIQAGLLDVKNSPPFNLKEIEDGLSRLIKKYKPEILAVEKLFFMKNQKTGIEVAQARGVIMLSAVKNKLKIVECAPNEMKSAVTGYGFADKKAVDKMIKLILNKPDLKVIDDAADALALAVFGASQFV